MLDPQKLALMDQSLAALSDVLPAYWRRLYSGLISEGFTESQAMELLKTYITSFSSGSNQGPK